MIERILTYQVLSMLFVLKCGLVSCAKMSCLQLAEMYLFCDYVCQSSEDELKVTENRIKNYVGDAIDEIIEKQQHQVVSAHFGASIAL